MIITFEVVDSITPIERSSSRFVRGLWTAAGTISLGFGILGIVLPLLPTTPFLLLAAFCYLRGSDRMSNWLLNHRWFGEYLRNYQEGRGIPLKIKIMAVTVLWITIAFSVILILDVLLMQILLISIAAAVTVHIIRIKTLEQ